MSYESANIVWIDGEPYAPNHAKVIARRSNPKLQESKVDPDLDRQVSQAGGVPERRILDSQEKPEDSIDAVSGTGASSLDGSGYVPFRITVTLRFSDFRRHDPDGCFSTIADCYVAAVRRLLDKLSGGNNQKRVVRKRSGGGNYNDRKDLKVPF